MEPPDDPLENLWERIRVIRGVATDGGNGITDGATIELILDERLVSTTMQPLRGMTRTKPTTRGRILCFILPSTKRNDTAK
jgi:hypothetical protein